MGRRVTRRVPSPDIHVRLVFRRPGRLLFLATHHQPLHAIGPQGSAHHSPLLALSQAGWGNYLNFSRGVNSTQNYPNL